MSYPLGNTSLKPGQHICFIEPISAVLDATSRFPRNRLLILPRLNLPATPTRVFHCIDPEDIGS